MSLSEVHEQPGSGLYRCGECGWGGIPTYIRGQRQDFCPACETDEHWEAHQAATKVGRNAPCPCGSGKKAKKCCAR